MSEARYLEQLQKLVELQRVDDIIHSVRQKLEFALEEKFRAMDGRRNHVLDKLTHLQEQQKRVSAEIDDDAERIKKSKNKLMQVGNSREYQAMLREMDNMEKSNRNREAEKTTIFEELQTQNDILAEIDKDYNVLKDELESKRSSLQSTIDAANAELERLNDRRTEASKSIKHEIFMRYEFIRKRLDHPVVVDVQDGICSGCHIAIPPQTFIELQTGQQILNCPNCQRLIFWDQHFEMPEDIRQNSTLPKPEASRTPDEAADEDGDASPENLKNEEGQ